MTRAMVLCAGLGTRLRPLTDHLPKPLLPLGDRPILAHITGTLAAFGFRSAVVNAYHRAQMIVDFAAASHEGGFEVYTSVEQSLLGTAGGLRLASPQLQWPVISWNGDIWTQPPLAALLARDAEHAICLVVAPARDRGTVGLDEKGHVVRLRGEQFGVEQRGVDYIGILSLRDDCRQSLPEHGCLIADVCLPLLRRGGTIATLESPEPWFDIGSARGYWAATRHWLATRDPNAATARWPWPDSYLAPGVNLAPGVSVEQSVIGANAEVSGQGVIRRCILLPGAQAQAPLADVIVLPDGSMVSHTADAGSAA
ncbi:MAG TPA: NDP-sugar synthase [Polyangiaceae bacterium]|nr:NDP-sugar synthase [Polyangiaceae bacterium]